MSNKARRNAVSNFRHAMATGDFEKVDAWRTAAGEQNGMRSRLRAAAHQVQRHNGGMPHKFIPVVDDCVSEPRVIEATTDQVVKAGFFYYPGWSPPSSPDFYESTERRIQKLQAAGLLFPPPDESSPFGGFPEGYFEKDASVISEVIIMSKGEKS